MPRIIIGLTISMYALTGTLIWIGFQNYALGLWSTLILPVPLFLAQLGTAVIAMIAVFKWL